jgi:hypothetical protein
MKKFNFISFMHRKAKNSIMKNEKAQLKMIAVGRVLKSHFPKGGTPHVRQETERTQKG